MNSDGSYFYRNECYRLADVPEVQEFMKKYRLKSYWHKETYEWFLFNNSFFQILMYEEWGSPVINFCYKKERKIRNYNAIFEIYGVDERKAKDIFLAVKTQVEGRGSEWSSEYHFLSMIQEIEEFFPNLPNDEEQYKKLFELVEIGNNVTFYFCDDRMRQVGINPEIYCPAPVKL